jgi:hypothetical protein
MIELTLNTALKLIFPHHYHQFFGANAIAETDYLYAKIAGYAYIARGQEKSLYTLLLPSLERILNDQYVKLNLLSLAYLWCYDGHTGKLAIERYARYLDLCPPQAEQVAVEQLLDAELLELSQDNDTNGAARYQPTYIGLGLINDDTGWIVSMFNVMLIPDSFLLR